jgi:hypothetical protein
MPIKRDVLERPFDPALIRSRRGGHGQTLSYVEAAEVVKKLNDGLDSEWSFEIVQHDIRDSEVIVLGKLSTGAITKMAFGGSGITVARDSGAVISLADDLKSAATDSMKKAASMLGVGLHLYSDAQPTVRNPPTNGRNSSGVPGNGGAKPSNGNGASKVAAALSDRLTQKQLSAIWAIARRLGLSTDDVRERATATFGALPEYLSRKDGSSFIQELQAEADPEQVSQ